MKIQLLLILILILSSSLFAQTEADQKILDMASVIAKNVEEIRGNSFKRPVEKGIYNRDQLRSFILENFSKEMPDEKILGWATSLKIFNLIPKDMDLKKTLVDFLVSQVGGFYDPETKSLKCISSSMTFLQRIVMAHEITHALQDQHLDLYNYYKVVEFNDDILAGRQSVIEGEATHVMNIYPTRYPEEMLEDMKDLKTKDIGVFALQQLAALQGAPPYFTDIMIFPYQYGEMFVKHFLKNEGWDKLGQLYLNPPHSSEQVIHPEKYFKKRDEPVKIVLPDMLGYLGESFEKIYENTMGEIGVNILLKYTADPIRAMRASAGWDGDTYAVFQNKETKESFMVWALTFDTERDAKQFVAAQVKAFGEKYSAKKIDKAVKENSGLAGCNLYFNEEKTAGLIEQQGKDVVVLDNFSSDLMKLKEARKNLWRFSKSVFDFASLKPLPYVEDK